jgi:hypothetical protein
MTWLPPYEGGGGEKIYVFVSLAVIERLIVQW